jgi:catechol 2,3-dioxygenase-like lactoylglutathione lyase family enzyme
MEARLSIVTLGVDDIERAKRFYHEGLGWSIDEDLGDWVSFALEPGLHICLYPNDLLAKDAEVAPERSGFSGITLAHNVDSRGQVDHLLAEAERAGGRLVKQAGTATWGGYSGYFADPDGHLWEVASPPPE